MRARWLLLPLMQAMLLLQQAMLLLLLQLMLLLQAMLLLLLLLQVATPQLPGPHSQATQTSL